MTNEQFVSRRQAREAERAGRVPEVSAPAELVGDEVVAEQTAEPAVVPAAETFGLNFPPLTKSQLVQMGRIEDHQDVSETSSEVSSVQVSSASVQHISTTGVVNPYAPKGEPVTQAPTDQVNLAPYDSTLAEAEEPITEQLFAVSPNLNVEPQTASIIIDNFEPLDNISIAISETGEMLKTGSIELPNISTNTGEMATILDAAQVDEAIAQDSVAGFVSTIAPLRASGVVNTAGKIGIMPQKSARNQGSGWLALTLSIVMVTIGGLVLAAFMLGILK
jgi:hypothetical protein